MHIHKIYKRNKLTLYNFFTLNSSKSHLDLALNVSAFPNNDIPYYEHWLHGISGEKPLMLAFET